MQNVDQLHIHDCHRNVTEPQATEYHKYTHVQHRNCESEPAARRVVQHTLRVM